MAISQPIATDKQNAPSHSLSHRVFANDDGASAKTIVASTGGKVGIGVDAPTAVLHLKAGTATANTGQIKLENSTLLATPEAGSIEFSDGRFHITGTAKQRVIDRTSEVVNVANVTVANTTTETTLYSWTLSANAMKVGRIYKLHYDGIISSANKNIIFNFYVGSTLYATTTWDCGNISNKTWCGDYSITIRTTGSSGTSAFHRELTVNTVSVETASLLSVDTTGANVMTLKVQWSDTGAGNSVTLYQAYLELKN